MQAQAAVIVALLSWPAVAATVEPPRLRVDHAQLARTIESASQRSPTFRAIVHELAASNVVVYVQYGKCDVHVDACLEYVTWAAPFLYVRAVIDPFDKPECVIAGLVAHELQHALELADAGVMSGEQFGAFYEKHGRRGSAGYETDKASTAGFRVEREFRKF